MMASWLCFSGKCTLVLTNTVSYYVSTFQEEEFRICVDTTRLNLVPQGVLVA